MGLVPIDEACYRELERDLYAFMQLPEIQESRHTDLAWHEVRNALCKYLWEKGYCKVE